MNDQAKLLWTPAELQDATGGYWLVPPPDNWSPVRVAYDVRGEHRGSLIVTKATSTWGRGAADTSAALLRLASTGAAGALIQNDQVKSLPELPPSFPLLLVPNTRKALRDLAVASRNRFHGRVIAVTGTVGKTTSREMLIHILNRQGGAVGTRANNNNIPGVCRTLSYVPRDAGFAVIEVGFGHPWNGLSTSSEIARPHIALVTWLDLAHLDALPSRGSSHDKALDELADAKSQIFNGLTADGVAVINREMPRYSLVARAAAARARRVLTFGEGDECNAKLLSCKLEPDGSSISAEFEEQPINYRIAVPGRHMVMNSLGVLLAARAAGADLSQAAGDLADCNGAAHRAQVITIPVGDGTARMIDDSFNANAASLRSTLELLQLIQPKGDGRRIAVFNNVQHLGSRGPEILESLAEAVKECGVDKLFTCGDTIRHLFLAVPEGLRGTHSSELPALYRTVREFIQPGDVVTLKGGMGQGGLGDKGMRLFARGLMQESESFPAS